MRVRSVWTTIGGVCLGVCAVFLISTPGFAQEGVITGTVQASDTGQPIAGAQVIIVGTARGAVTDGDGEYRLDVSPGVYTIRARFFGYEDSERQVSVTAGETLTADFNLAVGALLVDEIVAIGARTQRTVVESPVPVDVITEAEIKAQGHNEVNQFLTVAVPSFNANYQTIGDGSDHINPASLRGLGPDQVLVLVNGKRRHSSALLHVNGTFGRGTVGVDLNAIPAAAIKRIEVLRDGASAQYGSDAIAGVINIILKDNVDDLTFTASAGVTGEGDGEVLKSDVNFGFPISDRGYFNVTGEFFDRNRTNRSGDWTGDIFPGIEGEAATNAELARLGLTRSDFSMKTGQSFARVGHAFWNSVVPLRGNADFYTFGGVSHRDGEATGFYRLPNSTARVVPELYPNGFLPEIHTQITDASIAGGIRGSRGGWDMDLSVAHGMEKFQFNIENSNNASMGTSSPVSFDAGGFEFSQTTGNFDIIKLLDTGGAARSVSLVAGAEFRLENYEIFAGEDASWQLGNGGDVPGVDFDTLPGGAPKAAGSQVFPGFQPTNELDRFRNSASLYAGLETEFTDRFLIDVGGRFESYDDFGQTWTGKIATRLAVAENFALRAAVSNGFRAPSLHQVWFNNVSTQFVVDAAGELTPQQVLTSNNISTVTKAFGVPDLKEETSVNASAGFTAQPGENFSISADFYHITIDDRIVLTSRFTNSDPIVAGILAPFSSLGISQAQFFANAVDTKTNGIDIVASYAMPVGDEGTLNMTASANFTDTDVEETNVPAEMAQIFAGGDLDAVKSTLFNREERNRLEDALPHSKIAASARWESGRWSALARLTHFGKVEYKPTNSDNDETFDAKTLLDVDLGVELMPGVRWTVGANNVFDTFPDEHEKDSNRSGERFIYSRRVTQFGMNGGFYYTRLQLTL